jgi:hypothetical protein
LIDAGAMQYRNMFQQARHEDPAGVGNNISTTPSPRLRLASYVPFVLLSPRSTFSTAMDTDLEQEGICAPFLDLVKLCSSHPLDGFM